MNTKFADSWVKDTNGNVWSLELHYEEYPDNPRKWKDCMGHMVCWHRRYALGDNDQKFATTEDFWRSLAEEITLHIEDPKMSDEVYEKLDSMDANDLQRFVYESGQYVILPLYLYDHSNITMSTKPFSCPWDSGHVGYIYVSMDDLRQEYGSDYSDKELRTKGKRILEDEVEEYAQYIRGDVFRCILMCNMDICDTFGNCFDSDRKFVKSELSSLLNAKGLADNLTDELLSIL